MPEMEHIEVTDYRGALRELRPRTMAFYVASQLEDDILETLKGQPIYYGIDHGIDVTVDMVWNIMNGFVRMDFT